VENALVGKIPRPANHQVFRRTKPFRQIHKRCRNSIIT